MLFGWQLRSFRSVCRQKRGHRQPQRMFMHFLFATVRSTWFFVSRRSITSTIRISRSRRSGGCWPPRAFSFALGNPCALYSGPNRWAARKSNGECSRIDTRTSNYKRMLLRHFAEVETFPAGPLSSPPRGNAPSWRSSLRLLLPDWIRTALQVFFLGSGNYTAICWMS